MKKYIFILFVLFSYIAQSQTLVSNGSIIANQNTKIIIASQKTDSIFFLVQLGQSNAVAQYAANGSGYAAITTPYKQVIDSVKIYYEGDYLNYDTINWTFSTYYPNTNSVKYIYSNQALYNFGGTGLEVITARDLAKYYGRTIHIVKCAEGSLNISNWSKPSGKQWIETERAIRNATLFAQRQGAVPIFIGCAWLQGESDIIDNVCYLYADRLRTFIANLRAINNSTNNMPIYMFKLSLSGNTPTDSMNIINSAFTTIKAENPSINKIIETSGQPQFNGLHYSFTAHVSLGHILADSIKIIRP